jgi:hypothetical protein
VQFCPNDGVSLGTGHRSDQCEAGLAEQSCRRDCSLFFSLPLSGPFLNEIFIISK